MIINNDSITLNEEVIETLKKLGIEKERDIKSLKMLLTTNAMKSDFISQVKAKDFKIDETVEELINKIVERYVYKEYRLKNHLLLRKLIFMTGVHEVSAYLENSVELVHGDVAKKSYMPVFNYLKNNFNNIKASVGLRNACENPVLDDDAILIIDCDGETYYWLIDYSKKANIKKIQIVKAEEYPCYVTPYEDFMQDMFFRYDALPESISLEVTDYIKKYIKNNVQN